MKTSSFVVALILTTFSTFAQGMFIFANYGLGANAPITDWWGRPFNGPGFVADLYWAASAVTDSTVLTALRQPAHFSTNGYFLGGVRTIPGVNAGTITAQVRVWNAANFASWETALGYPPGSWVGASSLFFVTVTPPPWPPASLTGLRPFSPFVLLGCGPPPNPDQPFVPFQSSPVLIMFSSRGQRTNATRLWYSRTQLLTRPIG